MSVEQDITTLFQRVLALEEATKNDRGRYERGQEQIASLKEDFDEWRIESKVRDEVFSSHIRTISVDVRALTEELQKSRGAQEQKQKNDEQSIRTWKKISLIMTIVFGFFTMVATVVVSLPSSPVGFYAKFLMPHDQVVAPSTKQGN